MLFRISLTPISFYIICSVIPKSCQVFRCHCLTLSAPQLLMGDSACHSSQGFTVILFSRTSVEILMSCSWTVVVTAAGCPLAVNHILNQGRGAWFSSFKVTESSCFTVWISVGHLFLTVELCLLLQNKELRFYRGSCLSNFLAFCSWMYCSCEGSSHTSFILVLVQLFLFKVKKCIILNLDLGLEEQ